MAGGGGGEEGRGQGGERGRGPGEGGRREGSRVGERELGVGEREGSRVGEREVRVGEREGSRWERGRGEREGSRVTERGRGWERGRGQGWGRGRDQEGRIKGRGSRIKGGGEGGVKGGGEGGVKGGGAGERGKEAKEGRQNKGRVTKVQRRERKKIVQKRGGGGGGGGMEGVGDREIHWASLAWVHYLDLLALLQHLCSLNPAAVGVPPAPTPKNPGTSGQTFYIVDTQDPVCTLHLWVGQSGSLVSLPILSRGERPVRVFLNNLKEWREGGGGWIIVYRRTERERQTER